MAEISLLDQGQTQDAVINSGDIGLHETSTPTTPRGESTAKMKGEHSALSGGSPLSLRTAAGVPSPSQFSYGTSVASPGSRWDADASPSRYRAAPSSYTRQRSPRSRTVRSRRRAKADGSTGALERESSRIDNFASERSGNFASSALVGAAATVEQGQSLSRARDGTVDTSFSLDLYRSPLATGSREANGDVVEETASPRSTMTVSRAASLRLRAQEMARQQNSPTRSPSRLRAVTPGS